MLYGFIEWFGIHVEAIRVRLALRFFGSLAGWAVRTRFCDVGTDVVRIAVERGSCGLNRFKESATGDKPSHSRGIDFKP